MIEIKVPDIGDFKNVEIIEVLIKEGDHIKKNDPVLTLESDKSSVEVPSPFDGKISSIKVKVGDKVSKGSLIATLSNEDSSKITNNKSILPETEKIIQEAEKILKKTDLEKKIIKEELKQNFETKVEYKKFTNYSSEQDNIGDIDPEETIEWIDSLNGIVE
jgi:pyruvate dehydrogenase E1 component